MAGTQQSYQTPDVGTILPAKENTDVSNPGAVGGTGAGLNEWLQAQQQDDAFKRNVLAIDNYVAITFANWLLNYENGRAPGGVDAQPPAPPAALVVVVNDAEAGGITFDTQPSGLPTSDENPNGTGPYIAVCPVPAYTKAKIAGQGFPAHHVVTHPKK